MSAPYYWRRLVLIISIFMTASTIEVPTALAQDAATPAADAVPGGPVIIFTPSEESQGGYFNVELEPGEDATLSVTMASDGPQPFEVVTYAADAYTIRNGGMGMRDLESELTGATLWLDYPTETFVTVPGESMEREFSISVPEDASPGEYVTSIAMQTANPVNEDEGEGMFRLNQYYRTVIGIRILVPGSLAPELLFGDPAFVIEGAIPGIVVPVLNTGNQQTSPSGELRVTDAEGNIVLTAPVQMGRIYGGHETELWLGLSQPLPDGDYTIEVVLEDLDKNVRAELPPTEFAVSNESLNQEIAQAPITIQEASMTPMPAADNVQFANVDAVISNTGEPVTNAQLSLIAYLDGEEIERFPISQSLSLTDPETAVTTRYMPLTGWTSGEWTFELLLETVDSNGAAVVVASHPIEGTVTIP